MGRRARAALILAALALVAALVVLGVSSSDDGATEARDRIDMSVATMTPAEPVTPGPVYASFEVALTVIQGGGEVVIGEACDGRGTYSDFRDGFELALFADGSLIDVAASKPGVVVSSGDGKTHCRFQFDFGASIFSFVSAGFFALVTDDGEILYEFGADELADTIFIVLED